MAETSMIEPDGRWSRIADDLVRVGDEVVRRIGLEGHGIFLRFGPITGDSMLVTMVWERKAMSRSVWVSGLVADSGSAEPILRELFGKLFVGSDE